MAANGKAERPTAAVEQATRAYNFSLCSRRNLSHSARPLERLLGAACGTCESRERTNRPTFSTPFPPSVVVVLRRGLVEIWTVAFGPSPVMRTVMFSPKLRHEPPVLASSWP